MRGRVWKFGNNIDTDQIIPAEYLVTSNPKELAKHLFEKIRPELVASLREGDIIVAGENFGCGSSREHAPRAILGAGIACVIASSFARIFFRNAINIGLTLVECRLEVEEGDIIDIDFTKGKITNLRTSRQFDFKPLPEFLLNLLKSGGLVAYTKKQLEGGR